MTKVDINATDHQVVIEADGDLDTIAAKALDLWHATRTEPPVGPAVGFQAERANGWDHDRRAPVRAEVTHG